MRALPFSDPGSPDTRSPWRYLTWLARAQAGTLLLGTTYGVVWMVAQALMPWAIGHGIDGIADDDTSGAVRWALVVAGLGLVQAVIGSLRHRAAVANWLYSAFRTMQIVTRHIARTGPAVSHTMPTGEVVATVSSDASHIGHAFEVTARFAGAVASYIVVSIIVLRSSVVLGLIVLIGVPLLVAALGPLIKPLQQRQREQREALGKLTSLGADTVAGLRVLRGIGGESVFLGRYTERSSTVQQAGVRLAHTHSLLDAVMVLLPGVFLVLLTWAGARLVMNGTIAPGALVAMYGYAFFLLIPVRVAGETAYAAARAMVAARKVLAVLAVEREVVDHGRDRADEPARTDGAATSRAVLVDHLTGLRVAPGSLTMLVSDDPARAAALADRLGRLTPSDHVSLDDVALEELPLADVRRRIVVSDPEPTLFTGTLRGGLDPTGQRTDAEITAALDTAAAGDVLDALRDGLDSVVEERGRSLSGGQRQRVALARVLVADPEILVLVEPTSAVDAHTEAAIAANLRQARAGRTTVVVTASPLLLAQADTVVWFDDDRVAAVGTHDELVTHTPGYRRTVTREEEAA